MPTVKEIYSVLCSFAPPELQMGFDNSGVQIAHMGQNVSRALLALDITQEVIEEAVECGAELIISHHPLLFSPPKSITEDEPTARKLMLLAENRIAAISMHTNLDIAEGGVNDVLIRLLGAEPEAALDEGCGRIGTLTETLSMRDFLLRCKAALHTDGLRFYDSGRPVKRLAVMGGSGGDCLEKAVSLGCDTYVTADIKYHVFLEAAELGINLIDGDHFGTEDPVIRPLAERLKKAVPDVEFIVSKRHKQIISFM